MIPAFKRYIQMVTFYAGRYSSKELSLFVKTFLLGCMFPYVEDTQDSLVKRELSMQLFNAVIKWCNDHINYKQIISNLVTSLKIPFYGLLLII